MQEEEENIMKACTRLSEMLRENPQFIQNLMTSHAVVPIMELLEFPNADVIISLLKLISEVIGDVKDPSNTNGQKFQQSMSLVGLIPAIVKYASPDFSPRIRLEAVRLMRSFCFASDFTRRMYIACGGLPVLVTCLQMKYEENRLLIFDALDCIRQVFSISTNPKNDFCRLFCKYGLLYPLANTLTHLNNDKEVPVDATPSASQYLPKCADAIFQFSLGDGVVKSALAEERVSREIFKTLPHLQGDSLLSIMKSITNISMDPNTLDSLENAGALAVLVPFMDPQHPDSIQNHALQSTYYLTIIKASRQEQAVAAGVIPHLQRFIRNGHPLKQFAMPSLFQLAKTSKRTRTELRKHDGITFFLNLLEEPFWKSHALDALSFWLNDSEDAKRVEFITINHIGKLVSVIKNTRSEQFDKILGPMEKILQSSQAINRALGVSSIFTEELIHRLQLHANNNAIRVNLLKILTLIYDCHVKQDEFVSRHQLTPLLEKLAADKNAVVVANLAQTLLTDIRTKEATTNGVKADGPM